MVISFSLSVFGFMVGKNQKNRLVWPEGVLLRRPAYDSPISKGTWGKFVLLTRNSVRQLNISLSKCWKSAEHTFSRVGQILISAAFLYLNRTFIQRRNKRLGLFGFGMRVTLHGSCCCRECRENCPGMHFALWKRIPNSTSKEKQRDYSSIYLQST